MYGGNEMSLAFENRVFDRRSGLAGSRMACTLVTGFLGSGKTTLLDHILHSRGDLRLAVLVNEFADSDVDSLLLHSAHLNAASNLPTVSLTHGFGCCDVNGPFRESLHRIVDSKHNFDCLLIETSGLAEPDKFVAELEEVGINLDMVVAVVDAETLPKILSVDVVKRQLQHVHLVLLNKCDLATLGQISDAEDILDKLTGGAKIVRSQFCKVPLELVIDFSRSAPQPVLQEEASTPAFLSHEPLPKMAFKVTSGAISVGLSSASHTGGEPSVARKRWTSNDLQNDCLVLHEENKLKSRFVFQWSGVKRVEAISGGPWESAPKSCIVLIGTDESELEAVIGLLSKSVDPQEMPSYTGASKELKDFCLRLGLDGRFKCTAPKSLNGSRQAIAVGRWPSVAKDLQEPCLQKEPLVIFGLKGSPLHGIKESQLNGSLMRIVNGRGNIFLSATTSGQDYNLQLLLNEGSNIDELWEEIRVAAGIVVSRVCKNFCPCRIHSSLVKLLIAYLAGQKKSDLTAHVH
ncbi:hypothetical protein ACLOJK_008443 [Asimina triloba]